jgi:hypothetical protein
MSGYSQVERRINYRDRPQGNQCADCGSPVTASEVLCCDCRVQYGSGGPPADLGGDSLVLEVQRALGRMGRKGNRNFSSPGLD